MIKLCKKIKELIFNIDWYIREFIEYIDCLFLEHYLEICILLVTLSTISLIIIAIKL